MKRLSFDRDLTVNLKRYALEQLEVDLIGIAPADRLSEAPDGHRPSDLLPNAVSVIVTGMHVPDATLDVAERGVSILPYQISGGPWSNFYNQVTAHKIARFLGNRGFEALPLPNATGRFWGRGGDLSNKHAAVAAGLGTFGWNQLLLTPEFGSAQRIICIITDAPLEPDPMFEGELCDDCRTCVHRCPTGAISRDEAVSLRIGGREFTYGKLDWYKCLTATRNWRASEWGGRDLELPPELTPEAFWKLNWFDRDANIKEHEATMGGRPMYCHRCMGECPARQRARDRRRAQYRAGVKGQEGALFSGASS